MSPFRSDGKNFLYHVGISFTVNSILQAGLIAGGKDTKEGRQIVFFTPFDPCGCQRQEECCQGCAGQAADAVSAYTQVRMEDVRKLLKIPRSQNVQRYGFHATNAKIVVQHRRPSGSS